MSPLDPDCSELVLARLRLEVSESCSGLDLFFDDCPERALARAFDLILRLLARGAVGTVEGRVDVDAAGDCDIVLSIFLISTSF